MLNVVKLRSFLPFISYHASSVLTLKLFSKNILIINRLLLRCSALIIHIWPSAFICLTNFKSVVWPWRPWSGCRLEVFVQNQLVILCRLQFQAYSNRSNGKLGLCFDLFCFMVWFFSVERLRFLHTFVNYTQVHFFSLAFVSVDI